MKLRKFISDTLKFWHVYLIVFVALEILNFGVLSVFVHKKVCFWVSSFLILILCIYLYFLFYAIYDIVAESIGVNKEKLYNTLDALKNHIDKLDSDNKQLSKELANVISGDIKTGNDNIINAIHEDNECKKETIIDSIQKNSTEIKGTVSENTSLLIDKTNLLLGTQGENTDKVLDNYKTGIAEITELIKIKVDMSTEQNKAQTDNLLADLGNKICEKASDMISKIKEETSNIQQNINDNHKIIKEKSIQIYSDIVVAIENAEMKISSSIEDNKKSMQKVKEKADDILRVSEENNLALNKKTDQALKNAHDSLEKIHLDLQQISEGQTLHSEHYEIALEEKANSIIQITSNELGNSIQKFIEELNCRFNEFKKDFDDNNSEIEKKMLELHFETTKLLNTALDNIDDGVEKNQRYINLINNQLNEVSKNNKTGISNIFKEVEQNKHKIEEAIAKLKAYIEKQELQSDKRSQEYIKTLGDYYTSCFSKINNIYLEISSLSQVTGILNNMYSLLKIKAKEEKSDNADAIRIEEYKDPKSGAIVKNHYVQNKLSFSEMMVSGRKTYDIQYSNDGKAVKSRNYNQQGEMISEIEFYKNGQVKTRKEIFIKNGKRETMLSHFDEKGNKTK
ncbi:MAG: hypothetical protein E7392_01880 [Ruminococcaceae bacterium]|nr:hypothetical protein [Oscillospiraceae bacterium]